MSPQSKPDTRPDETPGGGSNKPWERPGQTAQNPGSEPPKKEDRERTDKDNETA